MTTEIDAFEFTRTGHSLEGCVPVSSLVRLASLLAGNDGEITWRLDGWRQPMAGGREQLHLRLRASGSAGLPCGRCLGVVTLPLGIDRTFLLAPTEVEAAELDDAEDELDVLVATRSFSVLALLEDEAILALPPAASHAQCDRPSSRREERATGGDQSASDAAARSPFAALQSLKRKPSS